MCELCGTPEEQAAGRKNAKGLAERLRLLAGKYENMAYGYIKPHTDEAAIVTAIGHEVIRRLVRDLV